MRRFALYLGRPIPLSSLPVQSRGQRLTPTHNAMDQMAAFTNSGTLMLCLRHLDYDLPVSTIAVHQFVSFLQPVKREPWSGLQTQFS